MSSPSDLLKEKEEELEAKNEEVVIAEPVDEVVVEEIETPVEDEIVDPDVIAPSSTEEPEEETLETDLEGDEPELETEESDETEVDAEEVINELQVKEVAELPTHGVSTSSSTQYLNDTTSVVPTIVASEPEPEVEAFPIDVFVGANCPKCNKMLHAGHLIRSRSSRELAFYKCDDDSYVAIRSH